mmetsp:Transcript_17653/g.31742  ORF Transcript_17653/g.31742 Transcript_17653/m.31742 type:complete len:190 (+) Transcript_17653:586-1155(+)
MGPQPQQSASQSTTQQASYPTAAPSTTQVSAVGIPAANAHADIVSVAPQEKCRTCGDTGVTFMNRPCSCEHGSRAKGNAAASSAATNKVKRDVRKSPDDHAALRAFIERRSSHRLRKAWSKLGREERFMRCRCLQDRLAHEAQQKFMADVCSTPTGKWAAFLGSTKGNSMLSHWIDKKVAAAVEKYSGR